MKVKVMNEEEVEVELNATQEQIGWKKGKCLMLIMIGDYLCCLSWKSDAQANSTPNY